MRFQFRKNNDDGEKAGNFQELGDVLRGHRASLGKSLINIQDEIGLRPWIILAIEGGDLRAFANPGLIGGYVRQYARFLNLDPDAVHKQFCALTGHIGRAATTERRRQQTSVWRQGPTTSDAYRSFNQSSLFQMLFGNISMIGVFTATSLVIFLAAAGYASLTLYNYFKLLTVSDAALQMAQIEFGDGDPRGLAASDTVPGTAQEPDALRGHTSLETIGDLQPVEWVEEAFQTTEVNVGLQTHDSTRSAPLSLEEGDRGYNPLDGVNDGMDLLPILEAMNPPAEPGMAEDIQITAFATAPIESPVAGADRPVDVLSAGTVILHPVAPAWIQVQDSEGTVYIERILARGEQYVVPDTDKDVFLRSGMSGYVYILVDDQIYGPVGSGTRVVKQVSLAPAAIADVYADRDLGTDPAVLETLN